ncbi:carboxypeptidase PM20D1 [Duganella sp. CF402]|uniref:M20 family peptidase n=1 Tax=unclassified Duganella TaxID=2636909 RepID=UPI0008AF1A43|nr:MULTISPECIES: M20 family peptidase [unclassified Duganella]RZT06260.1 carboxypeptidase PM20D1 [Duganella sp. BK701]SEM70193.1 carboxypeptidase PM20D1 [Duganella sp. CF402]
MLKRILWAALAMIGIVVAVLAWNTWRLSSRQLDVKTIAPLALERDAVAARLAGALKFRTISDAASGDTNAEQFVAMQAYLEQAFPRLHATLKREMVGHSMLFTWQGSDPQARPVMWLAHQDVVPVAPGTEASWQQPPFDGVVKDGFVWGRGSWDDKGSLVAQMEAVETLLAQGYQPRATLYLGFGADEEVGGRRGAVEIARLLKSRGVQLDYILDEGMLVTQGIMNGIARPVALIGVAEKGYASVNLAVQTAPGHSSMPPQKTAIGAISAALAALEKQQMPVELRGVARDMFDSIAPEMQGMNRVVLSNLWLFAPVVKQQMAQAPGTNAVLRTTTALTVVHAGNKDNVLPGRADAVVNFRIRPGDSVAGVMAHVRDAVNNDEVHAELDAGASEPSPVSPMESAQYALINRTIREVFNDAVVAPGIVIGATDARHYKDVSQHVYRFSPVRAGKDDLPRFHGTNERLGVDNYLEAIRFYVQLARNGQ